MKPGELFQRKRVELGLTVSQVAKDLYIQERIIHALENDNYEVIHGETYQKAFFMKYADYLGLGEFFEDISDSQEPELEEKMEQSGNIFGGEWDTARWVRVSIKLAAIILIPVFIVLAVRAKNAGPATPQEDPRVGGTQVLEVVPTETATPSWQVPNNTGDTGVPQLDDMAHEIMLIAHGQCWVKLETRDAVLYSGNMFAGDVLTFRDFIGFYIRAGRPEVLEVQLNGEDVLWEEGQFSKELPPGAAVFPDEPPDDTPVADTDDQQESEEAQESEENQESDEQDGPVEGADGDNVDGD